MVSSTSVVDDSSKRNYCCTFDPIKLCIITHVRTFLFARHRCNPSSPFTAPTSDVGEYRSFSVLGPKSKTNCSITWEEAQLSAVERVAQMAPNSAMVSASPSSVLSSTISTVMSILSHLGLQGFDTLAPSLSDSSFLAASSHLLISDTIFPICNKGFGILDFISPTRTPFHSLELFSSSINRRSYDLVAGNKVSIDGGQGRFRDYSGWGNWVFGSGRDAEGLKGASATVMMIEQEWIESSLRWEYPFQFSRFGSCKFVSRAF